MSQTANPMKLEKASRQVRHLAHFAIVEEAGMSAVSRLSVIVVTAAVTPSSRSVSWQRES